VLARIRIQRPPVSPAQRFHRYRRVAFVSVPRGQHYGPPRGGKKLRLFRMRRSGHGTGARRIRPFVTWLQPWAIRALGGNDLCARQGFRVTGSLASVLHMGSRPARRPAIIVIHAAMTTQVLLSLCLLLIAATAAIGVRGRYRREFIIREGYAGLLYEHGTLVGTLVSGRHICWGAYYDVAEVELHEMEPASAASGTSESGSVKVLFAEPLLSVRQAAANIRKKMDPVDRVPKNARLAGLRLRILLSEHAGPGTLIGESLRVRPSRRDD
jgi:hypothetical protein